MPRRHLHARDAAASMFAEHMAMIRRELAITPDFDAEVLAEAEEAAAGVRLPDDDRTDLELVTIDPPGAMDLDQALHIERNGDGFRVHYAIADVGAYVRPGGAIDREAHRRGQTLYAPESKVPLHPAVLSEGAASLLPDQVRPALLWTIELDAEGVDIDADVRRARVRSRGRFDYEGVQRQLDDGTAGDVFTLLKEVGELRLERERERGGVSLPIPEQEVEVDGGWWRLVFRSQLPIEQWNAEISLLTGMAAARLMMYAEVGILRTLPPADQRDVNRLRRTAKALHIGWPQVQDYPDFVRRLDPGNPAHAAMLDACRRLFRGAGYVAFDGEVPGQPLHAAIAAEYAHATAPLRRLVDRYVGETCVALCADEEAPGWVRKALPDLAKTMEESERLAHRFERAVVDLVEAGVLAGMVGQTYTGVVVDLDDEDATNGTVVVSEPAVEAPLSGPSALPLGDEVRVRLVEADVDGRRVSFELAGDR